MEFRLAKEEELSAIIKMLAEDALSVTGEQPSEKGAQPPGEGHRAAFREISADPNNELIVAVSGGELVGVFQLTFIPGLSHLGRKRAQIEGVRVAANRRGQGLGREMLLWAIARAREKGCRMVQLTSNKQRTDAIRFYKTLGFKPTHEGMKLILEG